eukprot:888379-Amphidinium_carterae.2
MSVARMNDVRITMPLVPGEPLEKAQTRNGGPAGDPQVNADLNTVRVWQRKLNTGTLEWPLDESIWDNSLSKGRGRGPIRHLKTLADRVGWVPHPKGSHQPVLVNRIGVVTVWTDGSGRHSDDPQHRRCGVGYLP